MQLSSSGQKLLSLPNAGGSSEVSEVLSLELIGECFGGKLLKTEMEVSYYPQGGSMTDYVYQIGDTKLGVSVTRAMKFRGDYSDDDAKKLLDKKLSGIVQSSKNSLEKWKKQILHVWATSSVVANHVTQAFDRIDNKKKSNTLVLITVAENCPEIFSNGKKNIS